MSYSGKQQSIFAVTSGFLIAVLLVFSGCGGKTKPHPVVKVGLGETVITPQDNLLMAGFARSQTATGVHDDLHARTIVVEGADGVAGAMMSLSLVSLSRDIVEKIRSKVTEATGIPPEHIIISLTHTHSGPNVAEAGERYQTFLIEKAATSAFEAWNNRASAYIGVGSTTVMELGRNRRRLLYGGLHPDPEVGIIKVENAQGKLIGVAFNYGCHPSALDWQNTLYSEDWPYYAMKGIKKELGETLWTAYFQSAEGDINVGYSAELSAVGAEMPIRNYQYIEHKGEQMSEAVLKALAGIEPSGDATVAVTREFYDYPLRDSFPVSLETAERESQDAQDKLAKLENRTNIQGTRILDEARVAVFQTGQRLRTARRFYEEKEHGGTTPIEQQALRIGDAVFVSVPGEVFSEIGLAIKEKSPFEKTFVIGLSGGYGGYMPTAKEYIEGDYEVDGSKYSEKTGDACVESSLAVINKVK